MDIKIVSIQGHGDQTKEHVYLSVVRDCDVGHYLIADTTYTKGNIVSNKLRHVYWFPDVAVKAGDAVVLRTGMGKTGAIPRKEGGTLHRFYWNLGSAVWNNEGDAAVLLRAPEWTHHKVS